MFWIIKEASIETDDCEKILASNENKDLYLVSIY